MHIQFSNIKIIKQQRKQSFCGQIPVSLWLVVFQFAAELIVHDKKIVLDSAIFFI